MMAPSAAGCKRRQGAQIRAVKSRTIAPPALVCRTRPPNRAQKADQIGLKKSIALSGRSCTRATGVARRFNNRILDEPQHLLRDARPTAGRMSRLLLSASTARNPLTRGLRQSCLPAYDPVSAFLFVPKTRPDKSTSSHTARRLAATQSSRRATHSRSWWWSSMDELPRPERRRGSSAAAVHRRRVPHRRRRVRQPGPRNGLEAVPDDPRQ